MQLDHIQAYLFDFDGLVLDTEWPIYQTWLEVFQSEGHDLPIETYVQCIGSDFASSWSPQSHLEELTGKSYDWDTINAERQKKIEAALQDAQPLPAARELMTHLKARSIPVAVVSSSVHRWVDNWLDKLALTPMVATIVCKGDAPKIKPAPDLYLEAVERLQLPAEHCMVLEDSLNGVKAAKAAGCVATAVPSRLTSVLDFHEADYTIDSLQDILDKLT